MFKTIILLALLNSCTCVTINIFVGIIGPWRQIELTDNQISSKLLKRGFISKIHLEEDEEIDEEEQIESITNLAGLTEVEMKGVGQKKVPVFSNLNLIKTIRLSGNQISYVDNVSFSKAHPRTIDLSNNHINKIENGAFGHSLEKLFLTCNDLTVVSSAWFEEADSLQILNLKGNKISIIPADFNSLTSLSELHISHNKITKIEDRSFSQKRYSYIDISYNNITEFKASSFTQKSVEFMYLNLRANRLNFLSEEFMKKAAVTVELTADLNPWLCPCNDRIRKWLPNIVLYNQKNSWLDAQAFDHAHRKDAFCINDELGSRECFFKVDPESTEYYLENIEPLDVKVCQDY